MEIPKDATSLSSPTNDANQFWTERKIEPPLMSSLGISRPSELAELEDEDIATFFDQSELDLTILQKRRITGAYREIKYNEGEGGTGSSKQFESRVPQQPQPSMRRKSVLKKRKKSEKRGLCCRLIGIATPVGSTDDIVENWNSLALISAMLTSISGGGLFAAAEYVTTARDAIDIADAGLNNTIIAGNKPGDDNTMQFMVAKWTMMIFCIDTFCFLNSTVITTFFVAFINRHPEHSTKQIYEILGSAWHWPEIYFRFGFFLMIAGLSLFFILVMAPTEMGLCLAFCVTTIIMPMCYALVCAMSVFTLEEFTEETIGHRDHRHTNKMGSLRLGFHKKVNAEH